MTPNPLLPAIPDLFLILAVVLVVLLAVGIGVTVWLRKGKDPR